MRPSVAELPFATRWRHWFCLMIHNDWLHSKQSNERVNPSCCMCHMCPGCHYHPGFFVCRWPLFVRYELSEISHMFDNFIVSSCRLLPPPAKETVKVSNTTVTAFKGHFLKIYSMHQTELDIQSFYHRETERESQSFGAMALRALLSKGKCVICGKVCRLLWEDPKERNGKYRVKR